MPVFNITGGDGGFTCSSHCSQDRWSRCWWIWSFLLLLFPLKLHCLTFSLTMEISAAIQVLANWLMSSVWFTCVKQLNCYLDICVWRRLGVDAILKKTPNKCYDWNKKKINILPQAYRKQCIKCVLLRYKYSEYVQCLAYQISRITSHQG